MDITEMVPAQAPWNVLVTAQEGYAADLRRHLRKLGAGVRPSGFRNVILVTAGDADDFLTRLVDLIAVKPFVGPWIGKALPIAATFAVRPQEFLSDTQAQLAPFVDAAAGRSFHVRVERRGHKGVLHTAVLEQQLGEHVGAQLAARGQEPRVRFDDADVVFAVEIAGLTAGIAVITRELRQRYAVVRID